MAVFEVLPLLEQLPIFLDLAPEDRERLAAYFSAYWAPPGKVLFKEGEPAHDLYFLVQGEVSVQRRSRNGPKEVGRVGVKSALGEAAFVDRGVRTSSALTLSETRALRMRQTDLDRLCADDPFLANHLLRRLLQLLARKLRKTSRDYAELL